MDDLDSAKCQKSRRRDMMGINKIVNEEKDKDEQCSSSPRHQKMGRSWKMMQWDGILIF